VAPAPRHDLDRYQTLARLGEGAFANVWKARDLETGREVALKILKEQFAGDSDVAERFRREAFAIAAVDSPHVAALYDFGISGHNLFIVMELVPGARLRDVMGVRCFDLVELQIIVGQIAHALASAHGQGIVHRDIKPENIVLVEKAGTIQCKVLDFGVAKLADLEQQLGLSNLTSPGACFGTPPYLAPEQLRGQAVDGRTDLFALGVVAYELVANRRPWVSDNMLELMDMVLTKEPPPIVDAHPSVAPRLEQVNAFFRRALAVDPRRRPSDPRTFFYEFGGALFEGGEVAADDRFEAVTKRSFKLGGTQFDDRQTDEFKSKRGRDLEPSWEANDTILDGGPPVEAPVSKAGACTPTAEQPPRPHRPLRWSARRWLAPLVIGAVVGGAVAGIWQVRESIGGWLGRSDTGAPARR
jgi:serine/threonine protein kinase